MNPGRETPIESNLVTVATFANVIEANLAKNRLAEMGVPSYLVGEEVVSMAWMLTNAVGGIQLQVNGPDACKALDILETDDQETLVTLPSEAIQPPGSIQTQAVDEDEDEDPSRTAREVNADRACMASLLSLIILWLPQTYGFTLFFVIWQVYVFALLLKFMVRTKACGLDSSFGPSLLPWSAALLSRPSASKFCRC